MNVVLPGVPEGCSIHIEFDMAESCDRCVHVFNKAGQEFAEAFSVKNLTRKQGNALVNKTFERLETQAQIKFNWGVA